MAVTLAATVVDCAPGNSVTLTGTNLVGATIALQNQGQVTPGPLAIAATTTPTSITFTVPDGATSNALVVTGADGSTASVTLDVVSQYMQAADYSADGEGTADAVASLTAGVLDEILRDASAMIDSVIGHEIRLLQVVEDHPFLESRRIYPFRGPKDRIPIVSLDALYFITSNAIETQFNVSGTAPDTYTSLSAGYFDVQAYAVGNAILLGAIQTIGFSANRWKVIYTAGYAYASYPRAIRKATAIIATELLTYGGIQAKGLGGFSSVKQGVREYDRRNEEFDIPKPAMLLLRPYISRTIA